MMAVSAMGLMGFEAKPIGWMLYALGLAALLGARSSFRRHIGLVYISLGLLGLIPITTEINNENFIRMGVVLTLAVSIPYLVSRYIFKDGMIRFRFHHGRRWFKKEVFYIVVTAVLAYLLVPFYLENSGAYANWGVERTSESIGRLFIGTNGLGIWDELFFVSTVLGVLRHYLKFSWANALQAVLFTSFLYELGFTGWGPLVIYPFALLQGYVFKQTDSLLYVITIHLTLDFILFLALLNAHHPDLADIFIT
jgi:membrane protease YdiL (CAAX protease family)